jgi:hypothetical protein
VRRGVALAVVVALCTGVVALLAVELRQGARTYGERAYVDPCTAPADPFPGESGIDAVLQRILLGALNGAACELGVGREELVLSLEPTTGFGGEVTWDDATLERALKKGLDRSIDDAVDRGTLPGFVGTALRFLVDKAPLDWILGRFDLPFSEGG